MRRNRWTTVGCKTLPQVGYLSSAAPEGDFIQLSSHEQCARDRRMSAESFRLIEEESNKKVQRVIYQACGKRYVVVNAPNEMMSSDVLDAVHDLPFTRLLHPKYK